MITIVFVRGDAELTLGDFRRAAALAERTAAAEGDAADEGSNHEHLG